MRRVIARRVTDAIRRAPPRVVLALAWLWLVIYAYPGQMTTDSFDHLAEARAGVYSDSHPPITSLLWKLVELVIAGGPGMLLLQSGAFLFGLYAVLRHTFAPRRAAWAAALLFVFPPVFLPFAVIWKDCLMAGFLMLGLAGLLGARRWHAIAGLAALVIATALRYNAAPATLPLVALLFQWRRGVHWLERYAVAAAAWLALTASAFGLNAAITDKQMHFWSSSLAVYDLVGTIAQAEPLSDAELERTLAGTGLLVHDDIQAKARQLFNPRDFLPIIADEQRRFWDLPAYGTTPVPEATRDAIGRAWADVLTRYPGAYVRYRAAVMAEVLSLTHPRPSGVVPRRDFKVPAFAWAQGVPTRTSPAQHRLTYWMSSLWKVAPIFVPWMYVVLALGIALLAIARRGGRDVIALCASGLAMEATLCVLAMSPDYRYSHWLVVTTCLAIVITVARRAVGSSAPAAAADSG